MNVGMVVSIVIFIAALVLIVTERVHRSVVAITGAFLILALQILDFDQAMEHVDFNTLGVLFGMMLFVAVVRQSGLFEYLSIVCARFAKGEPWIVMVLFVLLTAVLSALLDNVTTILLIGPMTLTVCRMLDINPIPFLMTQVMASNIGGTATLIGDPPNIMIGSAASYDFIDFIAVDTPAVIIILATVLVVFYFMYGRKMKANEENKAHIMELNARDAIRNMRLLKQSVVMIVLIVVGFMTHGMFNIESCVIALGAGGIILLISSEPIEEALHNVEWTTLVFFAGLFIIVGALSETGVIDILADWLVNVTSGNVFITMLVLLFASAIISSFLDNIPFVATMIPVLLAMQATGMDVTPLWWAVSLGACLGGNGSLIGASANVVLSDISKKHGFPISFARFFKTGFPIMLLTVVIAGIYLVIRFPPV